MKAAFLLNFIPPYIIPFFRNLSKRFDEFTVYISTAMEPNRPWLPEWGDLNVIVQKNFTINGKWNHPQGFSDPLFVHIPYDTFFQLNKFRPDVIFSVEIGLRTFQAMLYKIINPKCKFIIWARVSLYTEFGRGKVRGLLRKLILPRADAIIVNGRSGAEYISSFGIPNEKIFPINLAIENLKFGEQNNFSDDRSIIRFLYVGQIIPRKGIVDFFRTSSKYFESRENLKCEFWIVGDGEEANTLKNIRIPKNVTTRFFGNVPYLTLPSIYSQCDVLVYPTLADEWGYVVNEALSSGLPVFGSLYSQAVEELITDAFNGWLFYPDSVCDIFSQLDNVFRLFPKEKKMFSLNAKQSISNLTIESNVQKFMDVVSSLSDKRF